MAQPSITCHTFHSQPNHMMATPIQSTVLPFNGFDIGPKAGRKRRLSTTIEGEPNRSKRVEVVPTPAAQSAVAVVRESHFAVLEQLRGKYHTEMLSVISSTSVKNRLNSILRRISQFHPFDLSLRPGVVLLHARSRCAQKLFTIIEISKRRIHAMDQKWYQYNKIHQIPVHVSDAEVLRVIALLMTDKDDDVQEDDEEDAFDPLPATSQAHAVSRATGRPEVFFSVFFSRVRIPEFDAMPNEYSMQSNEEQIDRERRESRGIVRAHPGHRLGP